MNNLEETKITRETWEVIQGVQEEITWNYQDDTVTITFSVPRKDGKVHVPGFLFLVRSAGLHMIPYIEFRKGASA